MCYVQHIFFHSFFSRGLARETALQMIYDGTVATTIPSPQRGGSSKHYLETSTLASSLMRLRCYARSLRTQTLQKKPQQQQRDSGRQRTHTHHTRWSFYIAVSRLSLQSLVLPFDLRPLIAHALLWSRLILVASEPALVHAN